MCCGSCWTALNYVTFKELFVLALHLPTMSSGTLKVTLNGFSVFAGRTYWRRRSGRVGT